MWVLGERFGAWAELESWCLHFFSMWLQMRMIIILKSCSHEAHISEHTQDYVRYLIRAK